MKTEKNHHGKTKAVLLIFSIILDNKAFLLKIRKPYDIIQ